MNERVLIVLLTYKSRLDWLREAAWAINCQSHHDWICVVADSTPEAEPSRPAGEWENLSAQLMREIQDVSGDNLQFHFRHYPHQPTADVAFKVNAAAKEFGDCEFIVVISDDDYLSPFFLEKQIATLRADPRCGFGQGIVNTFGDQIGLWLPGNGKEVTVKDQLLQNQYAGTCVMRMAQFLDFGGYDKEVVPDTFPCGLEDFNLFVHFLRNGWRCQVVPEVLLFARQRPEQNNRRLYGTPLYSKMVHKVCERNGIQMIQHAPAEPGGQDTYDFVYEQMVFE